MQTSAVPHVLTLEDGQKGHVGEVAECRTEVKLDSAQAAARSTLRVADQASVERVLFSLIGRPVRAIVDGGEAAAASNNMPRHR